MPSICFSFYSIAPETINWTQLRFEYRENEKAVDWTEQNGNLILENLVILVYDDSGASDDSGATG